MKITYMGRRINGRFDSFKAMVRRTVRFCVRWSMISGAAYALFMAGAMFYSTSTVTATTIDNSQARIEALKNDVVSRLSACESAGKNEDAGIITFDTNAKPSIGQLQWQIKSVIYFEKKLNGNDITPKEAVLLALDTERASALAKQVIFEVDDGIYNWANCAKKLGLVEEVTVIKKID